MTLGDKPSVNIWGVDRKAIDHKDVDWRNSEFAVQVKVKSMWFQSNKSFGGCLEVEHLMVRQTDMSCPFDADESVDDPFNSAA